MEDLKKEVTPVEKKVEVAKTPEAPKLEAVADNSQYDYNNRPKAVRVKPPVAE